MIANTNGGVQYQSNGAGTLLINVKKASRVVVRRYIQDVLLIFDAVLVGSEAKVYVILFPLSISLNWHLVRT